MDARTVPVDLADVAPGPQLACELAGIGPAQLSGVELVTVAQALQRQLSYDRARFMAVLSEIGHCPDPAVNDGIEPALD